jgi:hypothetical protein
MAERCSGGVVFRTIEELAERCGNYCWLENRLFALTGDRASVPATGDPAIRVFLSEMSAQHAFLAALWFDRLPVRAGVDPAGLVVPPPGGAGAALDLLEEEADLAIVLVGLVEQFLPRLFETYEEHRGQASPVSEAPVRAVLELAAFRGGQEFRRGSDLIRRGDASAEASEKMADLVSRLQPLLGPDTGVFPAARAS